MSSPTICSSTSSRNTRPIESPNSSTTRAKWACSFRKNVRRLSRGIVSGTTRNSRRTLLRSGFSRPTSLSRSLTCTQPFTSSRWSPSTSGNRVWRDFRASSQFSSKGAVKSITSTSERGLITSLTHISLSSRAFLEISASCFVSSRERSLSSTRYINSSVLCTVHAVERGSMPSRYFSTNRAIPPVRPRIPVYLNTV